MRNFDFSFSAQNPNGLKEDDYIEFEVINGFTATTNDIMKNLNADFIKKIIFLDGSWSFWDMFVGGRADIPRNNSHYKVRFVFNDKIKNKTDVNLKLKGYIPVNTIATDKEYDQESKIIYKNQEYKGNKYKTTAVKRDTDYTRENISISAQMNNSLNSKFDRQVETNLFINGGEWLKKGDRIKIKVLNDDFIINQNKERVDAQRTSWLEYYENVAKSKDILLNENMVYII